MGDDSIIDWEEAPEEPGDDLLEPGVGESRQPLFACGEFDEGELCQSCLAYDETGDEEPGDDLVLFASWDPLDDPAPDPEPDDALRDATRMLARGAAIATLAAAMATPGVAGAGASSLPDPVPIVQVLDDGGDAPYDDTAPDEENQAPAKAKRNVKKILKLATIIVTLAATLLFGVVKCVGAIAGQVVAPPTAGDGQTPAAEGPAVSVRVNAEGADGTVPAAIDIADDEGTLVVESFELLPNELVEVAHLPEGTYRLYVAQVPANADGSTYLLPNEVKIFDVADDPVTIEVTVPPSTSDPPAQTTG